MTKSSARPCTPGKKAAGRGNWTAAIGLGLISSTYSTLVSQLSAARIGRDAAVDWMTVASIPARDAMLGAEPTWSAIATGIAFHQWADFSWALVFFGLLGRWTARLSPQAILGLAVPWAVLTSASEWFVLVPLFPFFQPLFTLQQPYWIGLLVHLASALIYPFFPALRGECERVHHRPFMLIWSAAAGLILVASGAAGVLAKAGHEWPWAGADRVADQTYMRHMTTHHAQGIELAVLAAERARDPHLRALARLMEASQRGENRIFARWWTSWFDVPMTVCSSAERAAMPGLLDDTTMTKLRTAEPGDFDALFVRLMSRHHAGAVIMADAEWRGRGDPRLRLMAHAIRHEQQGEIGLMHRLRGVAAVRAAVSNMLADNINGSPAVRDENAAPD